MQAMLGSISCLTKAHFKLDDGSFGTRRLACIARRIPSVSRSEYQLAARGTKERARLGWPIFGRENFILKTMMFRGVTTVLSERKHLKMVTRSVPDSVSLILGRTE